MSADLSRRKVTRVLVMLEYEPGDPDNGEVFDLTQLATELGGLGEHGGGVEVEVDFNPHHEYQAGNREQPGPGWIGACEVYFRAGPRFNMSSQSGRLVDAINSCGIDTERTRRIVKAQERMRKRLDKLQWELKDAKLQAAASIRAQHPIARVTATPLADLPKLHKAVQTPTP